jgi:hypothetical protein
MSDRYRWLKIDQERLIEGRGVVLESRIFRLRLPFGGFLWGAPSAVRVATPEGERRLPIRDVTRRWQIAIYGFSLICLATGLMARGRGQKE